MNVEAFIEKWQRSGGNERANTHLFVNDLCALIGVQEPQPTQSDLAANDYVYERNVIKTEIDGATSNAGSIATSAIISSWRPSRAAPPISPPSRTARAKPCAISWGKPPPNASSAAWQSAAPAAVYPETAQPSADILAWPAAMPDRFVAVAAMVDRAGKPIAANDVARAFKGTNVTGVRPVLDTLAGMGRLRKLEDGRYAA